MNNKVLIHLTNGAIVDITTEQGYSSGCETCDYGTRYITDLMIIYKNKKKDIIRDESMYDYGISLSSIMKVILNHQEDIEKLKEEEVAEFIKNKLENEHDCDELKIFN
ncbi:TPA: hypothetical protein KOB73_001357 [Clostridioides difficile]|uniref:hypothetical protein n=1 Tax=Clostridioides difficile TaxID=1496 RepID=UPI000939549C|nr:hypothetical protein [Clostridioides difficile]MBJ9789755.1 hypothetical protein [Clostridioides difficile]MBN5923810.1 hypothetical protein [Clostridioides difficile]SJP36009.1 Uncharacterised protein [Clostridioides difficile]HBE8640471.1 hypothetical protein [Clostridioides difficile]HBF3241171.1 hypothetical protein [Clostridioides difficile]